MHGDRLTAGGRLTLAFRAADVQGIRRPRARCATWTTLLRAAAARRHLRRRAAGAWYPELADCLLVAVTEKRTKDEIDRLAEVLERTAEECGSDLSTIAKTSRDATRNCCSNFPGPGCRAARLPACDVPRRPLDELLPAGALADAPPPLPELTEPDVVRHFVNLSTLNMSVDTHFYPLGSCTMKYNPKRNERLAGAAGHGRSASLSARETIQGMLELLYELQQMLAEIAGLPAVSLQPAAGAHGEIDGPAGGGGLFPRSGPDSGRWCSFPTAPTAPTRPARRWPASRRCR